MICLLYAHPYPDRSRANRALLSAAARVPEVSARSLYDLYPDFAIDVEEEQAALSRAHVLVFQHPLYWYSVPGLLKHWFDKVLARGWAYGEGGQALRGKRCLWAVTVGGDEASYAPGQSHGRPFDDYLPPLEQTARFCGMDWEPPFVLHAAHKLTSRELDGEAERYRIRLAALTAQGAA